MGTSRATVDTVLLRAISNDGRLGLQFPRPMRARLGWSKGDTILMRVSATTGNVIMTRVKQAADDDPNTLKDIQGSYNA